MREARAMDLTSLIGAGAAVFSTTSFAPQAWKIIKTRDTEAISARMYALTVAGFGLWSLYGFLRSDWTLDIPNVICLGLSAFILAMKHLSQRQKEAVADRIDPSG
jgi:MtN3 and saliva related transmembrane protein